MAVGMRASVHGATVQRGTIDDELASCLQRIAEHRGIAPETEPETNRYARVHSQIDCRVDTVTTNLYLSPGTMLP